MAAHNGYPAGGRAELKGVSRRGHNHATQLL